LNTEITPEPTLGKVAYQIGDTEQNAAALLLIECRGKQLGKVTFEIEVPDP